MDDPAPPVERIAAYAAAGQGPNAVVRLNARCGGEDGSRSRSTESGRRGRCRCAGVSFFYILLATQTARPAIRTSSARRS